MRIGVTGSHGFIGSNLSNELFKSGLQKRTFERFDRKKYDLFDVDSLKGFVEDKDVIVHLAGANRSCNSELVRVNTLGTLNLLEAIRKYSAINHVRFIFASSLQVYGVSSSLKFFKESYPTKPITMYGLSKKFAEETVQKYEEKYGLEALILRIASVYGPGCKPFYNSVISTFVYQALKGLPITINGTGKSSRDFIYVRDLTKIFLKAIEIKAKVTTVNVCTGVPTSLDDLIKKLVTIIGKNLVITRCEEIPDNFLIGDPSLCRRVFGLENITALEDGLKHTVEWVKNNLNIKGSAWKPMAKDQLA